MTKGGGLFQDVPTRPAPAPAADQNIAGAAGRRLRAAIVGTGMIAGIHRRSILLAGGQLIGVLGTQADKSREAAQRWNAQLAFRDVGDLVASEADVVHVCSPNATHAPYVEALLAAGKHVICEKPLGISLAEAVLMTSQAKRAGVVATVPFVYRYHPVVREIRARARAGEYGRWNVMHGHYLQDWLLSPSAANWRVNPAAGGPSRAFADIGSHWCDLVEWVSGQQLSQVAALFSVAVAARPSDATTSSGSGGTGEMLPVTTEDTAAVVFRTADGVPGSLLVSQVAAGRKNRLWFELDGSDGSAAFDQENPESFWSGTSEGSRTAVRDWNSGSAEQRRLSYLPAGHPQGYGDCFAAFVADTYAAIAGEHPDGLPTFADGLRAARIVDAVIRSAGTSSWTEI